MTTYPNVGALKLAATQRTAMAASSLRLYQGTTFVPGPGTTLAELVAIEADFSGYPAGGIAIVNFQLPLIQPVGGSAIDSGLQQFAWVEPTPPALPVVNLIGGWFLVDADGDLIAVGTFPNGIAVGAPGQGIPLNVQLGFGSLVA